MKTFPIKNKKALVTGASSGIGRAIALKLQEHGVTIFLVGRNIGRLREIPKAFRYKADLANSKEISNLHKLVKKDAGDIDILVHSAGLLSQGGFESVSIAELEEHWRVNVAAPYLLTKIFLPSLKKQKGEVVFVNSSVGLRAKAEAAHYSAEKHALRAIADSLRAEINPKGVRVMSIFAGSTATDMQKKRYKMEARKYYPAQLLQPEDIAEMVIHSISLPRTAEVTDLVIRPFINHL